jgi:ubiquinone/menaquinone biosynthesis C-methylase UbiE
MYLICIEKHRYSISNSTGLLHVASLYHTIEENRIRWNACDWSHASEEWTLHVKKNRGLDPNKWKASIVDEMILKYIIKDSIVVEIGPGSGRWTEILQPMCLRLLLLDISDKCLSICKERFNTSENVEYYCIEGVTLNFIAENSIDYIWSYDTFVHINPSDTENYIKEFKRILKPGGYAVIHHPGIYPSEIDAKGFFFIHKNCFRSHVDGIFFTRLIEKYGMELVEQNDSLPHMNGDLISVFRKTHRSTLNVNSLPAVGLLTSGN